MFAVPDCDGAGRSQALTVARGLEGVAREIRVVDLDPERTDSFDVTDWFLTGGDRDAFRRLCAAAWLGGSRLTRH